MFRSASTTSSRVEQPAVGIQWPGSSSTAGRPPRGARQRRRVAVLTNIPAPYRLEFFRLLAERHDLCVFFDAPSEPNRSWALPHELPFPHIYLKGDVIAYQRKRPDSVPEDQRFRHLPYNLLRALRRFRPEIVVSGELGLRTLQASLYARLYKVPLVIWWEGTPHTEGWVRPYRKLLRRRLVAQAERFWSNGGESAQLLQSYGAQLSQIDNGIIGTDTRRLLAETENAMQWRGEVRCQLGVSGVVFLYSGQFVKRKGIVEYLKALEALRGDSTVDFSLLFVGEGPERPVIESWKRSHPDVRVSILGFQQPADLPRIFAACDVFVLPTLDDNWSLAALEAAVAGLPQILSVYNGASADLLSFNVPAVCVDPYDTNAFRTALKRYAEGAPVRANNSRENVAGFYAAEAVASRACESIDALAKPGATA